MVFYRKYRPQTIAELDSKNVRDSLSSVLSGKDVPHALLFTGPKGLGKTSTARIIAKIVNCEKTAKEKQLTPNKSQKRVSSNKLDVSSYAIEPCNKCFQCTSITNGSNIDVLEIDGASNRGIDEIRDLREKIRLSPAKAFKKVYIIDEVHMLTTEAFNALLKTLEEPPAHSMFIFCTTEPHKVPATILSRCFHVQFNRASDEELVSSFKRIIEGEKLKAESPALLDIAHLSDGSFRDGAKILEEIVLKAQTAASGQAGKKITKELVEEVYQTSSISNSVTQLLELLGKKDTKGGLELITKLVEQGTDMKYFIEQLINTLHNQLLVQLVVEEQVLQITNYKLQIEDIKVLVELLSKAHQEIKYAVLPQLPLELAIIEWGVSRQSRVADDAQKFARGPAASSSLPTSSKKSSALPAGFLRVLEGTPSSRVTPRSSDENTDLFHQLIDKVKTHNHSLAGVLRGCLLESINDKTLTITTPFKFHKEKLEEQKSLEILNRVASEITGNSVSVSVLLKDKAS